MWNIQYDSKTNSLNTLEGPLLVVMNHVHRLDYFVVAAALPLILSPIMSFDVIRGHKFLSALTRQAAIITDAIVVYRHGEQINYASIKKAIERLKKGDKLLIAPQGRRMAEEQLTQFAHGAAYLSLKTNASILPVISLGYKNRDLTQHKFPRIKVLIGDIFTFSEFSLKGNNKQRLDQATVILQIKLQQLTSKSANMM